MPKVKSITNLAITSKVLDDELVTKFSFTADVVPRDLAEILLLMRTGVRVDVEFSSPQPILHVEGTIPLKAAKS